MSNSVLATEPQPSKVAAPGADKSILIGPGPSDPQAATGRNPGPGRMNMPTMTKLPSLSVFYPCYNEEANVERVTEDAVRICRQFTDDLEVIIVNDGSKDRTAELAEGLVKKYPGIVRAVHNKPNRGYGGALQRGFREATKEWIFYTDGDGQFDFQEIEKLIPMIRDFEIISGYRLDRKDPFHRKLNAFAWTRLVRFLFKMKLRDIDCAFKLYPRRFIDEIEMWSTGALIDTEMLAKATRLGYTIGQIGVHHYPRTAGTQTGAKLSVIVRAFKELFKLRNRIDTTARERTSNANKTN